MTKPMKSLDPRIGEFLSIVPNNRQLEVLALEGENHEDYPEDNSRKGEYKEFKAP